MKVRKSKGWCLTCREKSQTLDSDSSEAEETENKVDDKAEDEKMETWQAQKNIPSALSKHFSEIGFRAMLIAMCNDYIYTAVKKKTFVRVIVSFVVQIFNF